MSVKSNTVCVSGYVISIQKDVLTTAEYTEKYLQAGDMSVYPSYIDNGEVMDGDRYIYHIAVRNEGA